MRFGRKRPSDDYINAYIELRVLTAKYEAGSTFEPSADMLLTYQDYQARIGSPELIARVDRLWAPNDHALFVGFLVTLTTALANVAWGYALLVSISSSLWADNPSAVSYVTAGHSAYYLFAGRKVRSTWQKVTTKLMAYRLERHWK